jgi:hypothetical protein
MLCSRAASEPLEAKPRPRIKGQAGNYKFLLGKILFLNYDSKTLHDAEIRNLPLHLERLVCSVYNLHGITLYYTIAPTPVVCDGSKTIRPLVDLSPDLITDLLAP